MFLNRITKRLTLIRKLVGSVNRTVNIYEVGPRDGLQNQKEIIPSEDKIKMIDILSESGLKEIEVTSIVSPKWVPQLSDYDKVLRGIRRKDGVVYSVLIPNAKGFKIASDYGIKCMAVVASASNEFSIKNMNCNIEESLERIKEICELAKQSGVRIRGYVSSCFVCPYEGRINPDVVSDICAKLMDYGCYEIVVCDTLGAAKPDDVKIVLDKVLKIVPANKLAVHFHNTYGHALDNVKLSIQMGITKIDSSVGGLGGCPYAKSATGNIATEEVIEGLRDLGINVNVNDKVLSSATKHICDSIGIQPPSPVAKRLINKYIHN